MSDSRPVLLTRTMILSALKDDAFFRSVPEFSTLKPKLQTMGAQVSSGCAGCRGRKIAKNIMADFMSVLSVLDDMAIGRLKAYFGIPRLMFSVHDPATGAYRTKVI